MPSDGELLEVLDGHIEGLTVLRLPLPHGFRKLGVAESPQQFLHNNAEDGR